MHMGQFGGVASSSDRTRYSSFVIAVLGPCMVGCVVRKAHDHAHMPPLR
jgi:hypothetical protein